LDTKADAASVDDALALKADAADVYTQSEVDDALAQKPDFADVLTSKGESFVLVETTDDPVQNGVNLLAAYAEAAALNPYGNGLGPDNRAMVIVPPGKYDLGSGQLEMNAPFVDLVGSTTSRDNHHIFGTSNGLNTGVLRQTASNVRIENLFVECTRASGGQVFTSAGPAAYFPNSNLPNTVIRNCRFSSTSNAFSMRIGINYSGTYEDSTAGDWAFGSGSGGVASGTFTNCTGGIGSFGGGGTASGTFTNCTGGLASFGGESTASGTFTNCTGGNSAFGGFGGEASGIFINCVGGSNAFGGSGSASGGRFYYCVGGSLSFTLTGSPTVIFCVRNGQPYP